MKGDILKQNLKLGTVRYFLLWLLQEFKSLLKRIETLVNISHLNRGFTKRKKDIPTIYICFMTIILLYTLRGVRGTVFLQYIYLSQRI